MRRKDREMSEDKRQFIAKCPQCFNDVIGEDDWREDRICIIGECEHCGNLVLEEEVDWKELKK